MIIRFARQLWRAFFVGSAASALAAATALPAGAQFRMSWDANAGVSQFDQRNQSGALTVSPTGTRKTTRWLEQRAVGAAFRYDRPLLRLSADGVLRDGDVVGNMTGGMSAFMSTPSFRGVRFSMAYDARHAPNDGSTTYMHDTSSLALWLAAPKQPAWRSNSSATMSYSRNHSGFWVRATSRSGANKGDSLSPMFYETGFVQQMRSLSVGLSVGSQQLLRFTPARLEKGTDPDGPGPDTAIYALKPASNEWTSWSQTSMNVAWAHSRFAFDGTLSMRPRLGKNAAATWGEVNGTAALSSRLALVGSLRTTPTVPGVIIDARRVATLGLRFAAPTFWRPAAPIPVRSVSRAFDVQQAAPGQYVFIVNVPNARTVELAGDFTAWESVSLRQVNATRWEILLNMKTGSHRCNIRIDGAEWVPPPGIPTVKDDFNGRVGLFVAE